MITFRQKDNRFHLEMQHPNQLVHALLRMVQPGLERMLAFDRLNEIAADAGRIAGDDSAVDSILRALDAQCLVEEEHVITSYSIHYTKLYDMENVLFTSQLNLFSAFDQLDIWDVRWDNTLTAKVNSYVNVSLNVLMVHDITQTRRTQIKQALALGLQYSLL